MIPKYRIWVVVLLAPLFMACSSGYHKENGTWVWVSYDESSGKRVTGIDVYDDESFEVLTSNKNYAKDRNSVFFTGRKIDGADAATFEVLTNNGYSKDKNTVYLDQYKVLFADPASFRVLEFPYSKDAEKAFCGTLPIKLSKTEVNEFEVTNEDKLMAGMKTSIILSHFIELNPEYNWLDTLGITGIVIGEWATAETSTRKFKGFKGIEK